MDSGREGNPKDWIRCDESAAAALARAALERPALLPPPLHRVPLRPGNVVEIVGPSPSAKSEILIQAAISCILPREWKGLHLRGMDRLVVYFDLDCRFNVLRLAHCLKDRLARAAGDNAHDYVGGADWNVKYDAELFRMCMSRFLYIRCYNSLEFLAALKTMHCRIRRETEKQGIGVYFLMIDSISAFYWMDRAYLPPQFGSIVRKSFSLKSIMEAVVKDIQKFLHVHKVIVLATKSTILGLDASNEAKRPFGRPFEDMTDPKMPIMETEKCLYREFMPSVWQVFVSHRMCIEVPDVKLNGDMNPFIYTAEWILPVLKLRDKFIITDVGIIINP